MRIAHGAVLFAVGCLSAAGCSGGGGNEASTAVPTSTPTPSSISPLPTTAAAYLPAELQGTWHNGSVTIILADCAVGQECGYLVRDDHSHPLCRYRLIYRSGDAYGINFRSSMGNTFSCAWSAWSDSLVLLVPWTNGSIKVGPGGYWPGAVTLHR